MSAQTGIVIDALTQLHSLREVLDEALSEAIHEISGDPERLCGVLLAIREVRQGLAGAEAYVERAAGQAMLSDSLVLEGEWVAERHRGRDRKEWKHDDLAQAVVQAVLYDGETGELSGDPEIAWKVRDAFLNAARPEWRVRALRTLGIDPDNYCIVSGGRTTVGITRTES